MVSAGHQYTLVGFSEEVDRRPLFFAEPLPATRICSACGIVPSAIAMLPCQHFFCKSCTDQCVSSGRVACPLDGDTCTGEEVTWIEHPAGRTLGKQVLCWNHTNGCNVVATAADISKHFQHECEHHAAMCPKCSAEILASDVCSHLESHRDASIVLSAAAIQSRTNVSEEQEPLSTTCSDLTKRGRRITNANRMGISSIQALFKELICAFKIAIAAALSCNAHTDEIHSRQSLLLCTLGRIQDKRAEKANQHGDFGNKDNVSLQALTFSFVEKIETLEQTVKQAMQTRIDKSELAGQLSAFREAIGDGHRETKTELEGISMEIDSKCHKLTDVFHSTFAHLLSIMPVATAHTWIFEGYGSLLKKFQTEKNTVSEMLEPVYLRGYCVSAGVVIHVRDSTLSFRFQLHKGKLDQFLQWPFNFQMKFRIIHPKKPEKLDYDTTPRSDFEKHFLRPINVDNSPISLYDKCFKLADLEYHGFDKEGRITLSLELEPIAEKAD